MMPAEKVQALIELAEKLAKAAQHAAEGAGTPQVFSEVLHVYYGLEDLLRVQ